MIVLKKTNNQALKIKMYKVIEEIPYLQNSEYKLRRRVL